jgi:ribonuclease T2
MPARRSCLDRHEWLKHGTCSGLNEATYFEIASALALDAAKSSFAAALQSASGGVASRQALRLAFEESFGPGSARAMSLQCRKDGGRAYLSAVWIRLTAATATLDQGEARLENELLDTSIAAKDRSCPALIYVDPQGL